MISTKHYAQHIIEPYFALDTNHLDVVDVEQVCSCAWTLPRFSVSLTQIEQLKELIEQTALAAPYIGEQIPTRWLEFENDLNRLKKQQENFYASLDQVPPHCSPLRLSILRSRFAKSPVRKTSVRRMNWRPYSISTTTSGWSSISGIRRICFWRTRWSFARIN